MANKKDDGQDTLGAWAKRCFFAGRAAMEAMLRPFGLGTTQWYVLHHLADGRPAMQSDLVRLLQVERATMSGIVAALVRKDLVEQVADPTDQRRKLLRITTAGRDLWDRLPDLAGPINEAAFAGISEADMQTAMRVLRTATARLATFTKKGNIP